nr:cytochrome P450 6k1-like [Megalopta genalis]
MAFLTPHWILDGILICASLIVAAYMYVTRNFKYWAKRGVPEIPPAPFVGNFGGCLMLKKASQDFAKELHCHFKGEPYAGFYIFDKPFFLVRDPELVKHVMVKDFGAFADRYASSDKHDPIGSANLFLMNNPRWRVLRMKLTPLFTSGRLKKMFDLMLVVADELDRVLEESNLSIPKVMEMKDLAANFTTDLIATTIFGIQVNSLRDPKTHFREQGRKVFDYDFLRGLEFLIIFFMPHLTKYYRAKFFGKQATEYFRSIVDKVMNQRIETGEKRNDLIDLLVELKQTHENEGAIDGFKFSYEDLLAQAGVFYVAGFETSSSAMAFGLYELALNMDVQKTLRTEIREALDKTEGRITYEMIMTLPYLDMVVSEVLRKYPTLGFLERVAATDYKVRNSDLVLEKGTPVYISLYGMHYDPEYYPDPEKFDPMRFSEENKKNRPSLTYFPFGEGPRACIGLRMGLMQTKLGIVRMLSKYEVLPCEKTPVPVVLNPKASITASLTGLYLNVRKITTEPS